MMVKYRFHVSWSHLGFRNISAADTLFNYCILTMQTLKAGCQESGVSL